MSAGQRGQYPRRTLLQAFDRYEQDVSSTKRGENHEILRFTAIRRDFPELVAKVMHEITSSDLAAWRDARLKVVSKGTVQRDINLLRNVWSVAAREWKWCGESPWREMSKPGDNPARTVTWGWRQIRQIVRRLGYVTGQPPLLLQEEVAYLFLLGVHTGMRQSELCGLTKSTVDLNKRVVTLKVHKTVESVGERRVPIPRRAMKLIRVLHDNAKGDRLVRVKASSVDALFRKCKAQIGIEGLTFHDGRATAATLLARKRDPVTKNLLVDPLTLARILGHKNLAQLINTYFREGAESIAARI